MILPLSHRNVLLHHINALFIHTYCISNEVSELIEIEFVDEGHNWVGFGLDGGIPVIIFDQLFSF